MSLVAHVPELPGVDPGNVPMPEVRDPNPETGMYVGRLDAFLPNNWPRASSWDWYEKCLPLPCSRCGLTFTHIHGTAAV